MYIRSAWWNVVGLRERLCWYNRLSKDANVTLLDLVLLLLSFFCLFLCVMRFSCCRLFVYSSSVRTIKSIMTIRFTVANKLCSCIDTKFSSLEMTLFLSSKYIIISNCSRMGESISNESIQKKINKEKKGD